MTTFDAPSGHEVARTLARAFREDPLFSYFFPRWARRERESYHTFRFLAAYAARNGAICAQGGVGAAIWLPSVNVQRSIVDYLRFGGIPMAFAQGPGAILRQVRASAFMQDLHGRLAPPRHWYLSVLGVDPAERGRGHAARLLTPQLAVADRENAACYLDTHNENNVGLYERFGFRVVHQGRMPGTTVRHWVMLRPAKVTA